MILEEIISAGTVYVSDLAKKYEVTYETIRKDLTHLEKKGCWLKAMEVQP
ncbi:Putative aga operon transcriptional repressor [Salmonella enterica subsp. enterica serovar Heidelberg str. RI-11-013343]|nr:Putative aga operon transcriptional repressor [Salmonella enterica subsp. enterica serovar Heidelberg str. RI-11-013343]